MYQSGRPFGAAPLSPARPLHQIRQLWVIAHRWAGLTIAGFLIVAGLTGALLPWEQTLAFATRPDLAYVTPPSPGARPLDPVTLAERVEREIGGSIGYVPLEIATDHVVAASIGPRPGGAALAYDSLWIDPYTGRIRLAYRYGALGEGFHNLVPFLYQLHYGLVLGSWGILAFGLAALVWTLDCFIGFYLTLPLRPRALHPHAAWWRRWLPAWTIRGGTRGHKRNFDLHRAGGLWLWPLLLVFAWSAVGFNLPQVQGPVMRALGGEADFAPPISASPLVAPPIDRRAALAIGARLMAREAARRGALGAVRPQWLAYLPEAGAYRMLALTGLDWADDAGRTDLWFSARDGRLLRFTPPLGRTAADGAMEWSYLLHMAAVFGLPYRIFVSAFGLAVAALSLTGVLIWMRKRSARILSRPHRRGVRSILQPAT